MGLRRRGGWPCEPSHSPTPPTDHKTHSHTHIPIQTLLEMISSDPCVFQFHVMSDTVACSAALACAGTTLYLSRSFRSSPCFWVCLFVFGCRRGGRWAGSVGLWEWGIMRRGGRGQGRPRVDRPEPQHKPMNPTPKPKQQPKNVCIHILLPARRSWARRGAPASWPRGGPSASIRCWGWGCRAAPSPRPRAG